MLILSNSHIVGLLPSLDVIAAVEAAAGAHEDSRVIVPQRQHLDWNGNTLLIMPAVAEGSVGVKLVSMVPGNAAHNLPVTNGLMVLGDGATGLPLAVMSAAALTAVRTGAVGALGVKYMTSDAIASVGIIGCGVQGAWQAIFACSVRPIREIFCVCRSRASFEKFTATVTRHVRAVTITPCGDARELLGRSSNGGGLIIAATTSAEPVLPDDPALLEGKHFIGIGSYKPTMQELPDSVFRLAGELALDSEAARHEAGDAIRPVQKGILKETDLFTIGQLVTGRRTVDKSRTTVYKSVGMALYDLFVAQALYQAAKGRNIGQEIVL
jgi:ornithine cyclodeaminase/alanine dehydrogenase-like protein (mu-crystallin family)